MPHFNTDPTTVFWLLLVGLAGLQLFLTFCTVVALRQASRERSEVYKEMFGLIKKLEGLTASRREQMSKQFDKILENLSLRLPPAIAAQASQSIFEAESKILARLAELEPNLRQDRVGQEKMDDLIKSMEKLEHTIVALTAESVRKVMLESRQAIFADDAVNNDQFLAA